MNCAGRGNSPSSIRGDSGRRGGGGEGVKGGIIARLMLWCEWYIIHGRGVRL